MKTEFKFNNKIFGIDGSRLGWVVSSINSSGKLELSFTDNLNHFFDTYRSGFIVIDMPVHLPKSIDSYPRFSDKLAKKYLGKKHSSIFYAPLAKWLDMDYLEINHTCSNHNKPKLSKQSYNLFKKIKEIQSFLEINPQFRVYEGHPECFFNHHPIHHPKKSNEGIFERISLLKKTFPMVDKLVELFVKNHSHVSIDDCLDSISMLITVKSILNESARSFHNDIYY